MSHYPAEPATRLGTGPTEGGQSSRVLTSCHPRDAPCCKLIQPSFSSVIPRTPRKTGRHAKNMDWERRVLRSKQLPEQRGLTGMELELWLMGFFTVQ